MGRCPVCSCGDDHHSVVKVTHLYIWCRECGDTLIEGRRGFCYVVGPTTGGLWGGTYFSFVNVVKDWPGSMIPLKLRYEARLAEEQRAKELARLCAGCGIRPTKRTIMSDGKTWDPECWRKAFPERAAAEDRQLALCRSGKCGHGPHSPG